MQKNKFPFLMKAIAIGTTLSTLILLLVHRNLHCPWALAAAISCGTTAYHFVMRLGVGHLILAVTKNDFDYHHPWFQPRKWEPALYAKLQLKRRKEHLPTYDPSQFSLESNSVIQVIQNTCGAEVVHEIIMVLSFLPILTVPVFGAFPVFLVTSVLAALYDSIFVMAQRFNRPRLIRILEKQEAKCP